MSHRGVGDRWLAGEAVAGVEFAWHEHVSVTGGRYAGKRGTIALLIAMDPEPAYLVRIDGEDVRVRQSSLAKES